VAQAIDAKSAASSQHSEIPLKESIMNTITVTTIHKAIYCAIGAALLIGLAGVSTAAGTQPQDVQTKTVRYEDLDLSKPAGAKALYDRIRVAAQEVCSFSGGWDWRQAAVDRTCTENAIDGAVKKVNSPTLTTLRFGSQTLLASK
jgi:UrcA family protein